MTQECIEEDPTNYFTEVMGTGGEVVETAAFGLKQKTDEAMENYLRNVPLDITGCGYNYSSYNLNQTAE